MIRMSVNMGDVSKFAGELQAKLRGAIGKAMASEGKKIQQAVRTHVNSRLHVQKKSVVQSFTAKVLDQDPLRLPGLLIRSKIPWMALHETGGTITGKMLIPLNGRIGRKAFKVLVDQLMRGGNAYFIKKGGRTILMAENLKEYDRPLAKIKRRYRQAEGIRRLKRGTDVPIAVLVNKVNVKKRLDVESVVKGRVPSLSAAIQKEIGAIRM
jgi:hypothetical protein